MKYELSFLVLALLCSSWSNAEEKLSVDLLLSKSHYSANDTVVACLKLNIPSKFHLYGNPLGPGIGKPLIIKAGNENGIQWNRVMKQKPRKFTPVSGEWVWAYEGEAYFFIKGILANRSASSIINDTLIIDGLICHTACIPVLQKVPIHFMTSEDHVTGRHFSSNPQLLNIYNAITDSMEITTAPPPLSSQLSLGLLANSESLGELSVQNSLETPEWDYSPLEKKIEFNLFLALFFGFIAGIILNVMPCVLPVLGIKILSFAQSSQASRRDVILRSGMFSLGIIFVFMVLASLASFANFSWGEQFQKPQVLVGIIVLIVIFALGMFDIFTFVVPGVIGGMERKSGDGLWGDLFRGMFATVLATPCSGPLLGATLAWTLTQTPTIVFIVFASIGLGMAFPYLLFSFSRRLARLIPKPGNWMNDFKYFMGFILLGMAVYLMIGLPSDMLISTIGLCLVLSFTVWGYTRFAPWGSSLMKKLCVALIMLTVSVGGIYFNFVTLYSLVATDTEASNLGQKEWIPFSPKLLKDAHANGTSVMIDFTANWCMNCQYNKVTVLHSKKIRTLISDKKILTMKADLTRPNQQIESLLEHLGSKSVPFLAVFPGDKPFEPIVMRDLLNKNALASVLEHLKE